VDKSRALKAALKATLLASSSASLVGHDPYRGYNFLVEVGGVVIGGFTEVSGLESEIELEPYIEGGVNGFTHHFPTRTKASNIVLKRGLTFIDTFWLWFEATSKGVVMPMNGVILLLNSQQIPVMWWIFKNAYPVKWNGPSLKADSDEVAFESIELVHQGITKLASPI
jgi:phage tail-like protein